MMKSANKTALSASVIGDVSGWWHPESVLAWRKSEFERMDFAPYVADYLASTRIDLHQMFDLLDKGCPHDLAADILKGTCFHGDDPADLYEEDALFEPGPPPPPDSVTPPR